MKVNKSRKAWLYAIALAAALTVIFCATGFLCAQALEKSIQRETTQYLDEVAAQSADIVRERLWSDLDILKGLSAMLSSEPGPLESGRMIHFLKQYLPQSQFRDFALILPDGTRLDTSGRLQNVTFRDYFQRALAGEAFVSDLLQVGRETEKSIVLAVPVFQGGAVTAVLSARYHESSFNDILPVTSFNGEGVSYIASGTGEIFAYSDQPGVDRDFHSLYGGFSDAIFDSRSELEQYLSVIQSGGNATIHYEWKGNSRYMSGHPIGLHNWYLLSVVPGEIVSRRSVPLFLIAVTMCAAVLLICGLLVIYIFAQQKRNRRAREKSHLELKTLSDNIPGGVFRCSADDEWIVDSDSASEGFLRLIGYTAEEFSKKLDKSFAALVSPRDRGRVFKQMEDFRREHPGETIQQEYPIVCADGTKKWILNKSRLVREGQREWYYCLAIDITEAHRAQNELRYNQERYNIIIEQTMDIIFEWNMRDNTIYHSPYYREKFGCDPPFENFPESILEREQVHPDDIHTFQTLCDSLVNGERYSEAEFRLKKADGVYLWCRVRATALADETGVAYRAVGMITDIDNQKRESQKLEDIAQHDALTRLYNKGTAEALIRHYIQEEPGRQAALFAVDVDDFKQVNDRLGHIYGDAVLSEFARAIGGLFRTTDIVGRAGGDEFIVFVKDVREDYDLEEHAQKLSQKLRRSILVDGKNINISGSIGVARFPEDGKTFEALFARADQALYYVKDHGKDSFAVFDSQIGAAIQSGGLRQDDMETVQGVAALKKSFHENISEYIFNILYEHPELDVALPLILELVGRHCGVSRAVLYDCPAEEKGEPRIYEWCAPDVSRMEARSAWLPAMDEKEYADILKDGLLYCQDPSALSPRWEQVMRESRMQSFLYCSILGEGVHQGWVGFERCLRSRHSLLEEADNLRLLSHILEMFLTSRHVSLRLERSLEVSRSVLDHLHSMAYVIDAETRKLLLVNRRAMEVIHGITAGGYCYRVIRGKDAPCEDCPMDGIGKNGRPCTREIYNEKRGVWTETTASRLQWENGRSACLIDSYNINRYKEKRPDRR